ncbi:MAG: hypothetical protein MUP70_01795 [Candidatus Aminicenantes bacterium]|nr:hypothetical protein [Candidatus Aminicenantes bacterium]
MKRKPIIRLLSVLTAVLMIFLIDASSQSQVKAYKLTIFAEGGWQSSGVQFKGGEYYSVHATGSWTSGFNSGTMGPEGEEYGTITDHSLLGQIAAKRPEKLGYESYTKSNIEKLIRIGRGGMFKAKIGGILWLAMGEWSGCKECTGEVEVLITVYQ